MNMVSPELTASERLSNLLRDLQGRGLGCSAIKAGMESERQIPIEVMAMARIAKANVLPFAVKIGGVDAMADLDVAALARADRIILPMVESAYALELGVRNAREAGMDAVVNIETEQAWRELRSMLESIYWPMVSRFVIGRSDLARSMGHLLVDCDQVTAKVEAIIQFIRSHAPGIPVGIGGSITPKNAEAVAEIGSDTIGTRNLTLHRKGSAPLPERIRMALEWEIEFNRMVLERLAPINRGRLIDLIENLQGRL